MLRNLRSLQSLLVFETAGRCGSFKEAAAELNVTPSAVSRQIRLLEDDLGVELFRRLHRGLELSPAGAVYLAEVAEALQRLDRAGSALRARRQSRPLRLSVLHGFAGSWLVPRLPRFEAAHPQIEIRLDATSAYADFRRDDVDLAIRFGSGDWPGLAADRLLDLDLFPVCAPALMRGRLGLRQPSDLAKHAWLDDARVPNAWQRWLRAAGVEGLRPRRRLEYDNVQLMLEAAVAGLGVALSAEIVAERLLREGRLVRPFAVADRSPHTYHLVARPQDLDEPRIRAFRTWIHGEMATWRLASAAPSRMRRAQARVRKARLSPAAQAR